MRAALSVVAQQKIKTTKLKTLTWTVLVWKSVMITGHLAAQAPTFLQRQQGQSSLYQVFQMPRFLARSLAQKWDMVCLHIGEYNAFGSFWKWGMSPKWQSYVIGKIARKHFIQCFGETSNSNKPNLSNCNSWGRHPNGRLPGDRLQSHIEAAQHAQNRAQTFAMCPRCPGDGYTGDGQQLCHVCANINRGYHVAHVIIILIIGCECFFHGVMVLNGS